MLFLLDDLTGPLDPVLVRLAEADRDEPSLLRVVLGNQGATFADEFNGSPPFGPLDGRPAITFERH